MTKIFHYQNCLISLPPFGRSWNWTRFDSGKNFVIVRWTNSYFYASLNNHSITSISVISIIWIVLDVHTCDVTSHLGWEWGYYYYTTFLFSDDYKSHPCLNMTGLCRHRSGTTDTTLMYSIYYLIKNYYSRFHKHVMLPP